MTTRPSLKTLVGAGRSPEPSTSSNPAPPPRPPEEPVARVAATRIGSRQVSGHFKAEVAQALRMLAAEQDREQQELLAEALNMLFERYGKPTRAEVLGTRRKRT
jgi:hypothetical protein